MTPPDSTHERLPWRGPPAERPPVPVPPQQMPLRLRGRWRKRWRWVGAFGDSVMLCVANVEVGPMAQSFWAIWDRSEGRLHEETRTGSAGRLGPIGRRGRVSFDGRSVDLAARRASARLELETGTPIECVCGNDLGGYTWTRKLAGNPVRGDVVVGGRGHELDGFAVEDDSAGYHPRHTSWLWSAGVGRSADGRRVGWNLVEGINDPPVGSERAIWVDGDPSEPQPVRFHGLEAIRFADGSTLRFEGEAERARNDRLPPLFRSRYRAPFGTFSGSLGGIELESGLGVMEQHDAVW